MTDKNLRLFLAIPLSKELVETTHYFLEKNPKPPCRIIPEENWHITTLFLGDFPSSHLQKLYDTLRTFYLKEKPFNLYFDRFEYAPISPEKSRMIWMYFEDSDEFSVHVKKTRELVKKLYDQLHLSFEDDFRHQIVPHVTLCRFRPGRKHLPPLIPIDKMTKTAQFVQACYLYSSQLLPEGARYSVLHKFSFMKKKKLNQYV